MKLTEFNRELGSIIESVVREEVEKSMKLDESTCNECGLVESECKCINESDADVEEGNKFTGERAKAIEAGEDEFEVDGKTYSVKESKKKVLRLTEDELVALVEKLVQEQKVPGLDEYEKAHKESGKQNKENDDEVSKKMSEYSDIEGNTSEEFPKANSGDIKADRVEDEEEIEFIEDIKGGMHALEYDRENEAHSEMVDKQLKGDSTQGNAQVDEDGEALGNVVPTETGEKLAKAKDRQGLSKEKKKGYNTFPQKVQTVNESMINENVSEDMAKIRHLLTYSKKTQ
jgi:hypothetical protein